MRRGAPRRVVAGRGAAGHRERGMNEKPDSRGLQLNGAQDVIREAVRVCHVCGNALYQAAADDRADDVINYSASLGASMSQAGTGERGGECLRETEERPVAAA